MFVNEAKRRSLADANGLSQFRLSEMKTLHIVVGVLLIVLNSGPLWAQQSGLFDELAELYPDRVLPAVLKTYHGDSPRAVPAGVHIMISGLQPGTSVQWRFLLDEEPVRRYQVYRLIDVPVEQNTGLDSRTEIWKGTKNPHVIRRAPFRVYEVLEPIEDKARADDNGVLALRLEVVIPASAQTGSRDYEFTVIAESWQDALNWKLQVHPAVVRPLDQQRLGYTNWFSLNNLAKMHKTEMWSEPFWEMLGRYGDLMARGRQNTILVSWNDFIEMDPDGKVTVHQTRLKRYIQLFLDRGFTRIESGHLAGRHNGDWGSARLDNRFTGSDVNSDRGREELSEILKAIRVVIDKLKLPEEVQFLQHLTDEPTNTNAASYQKLAEQVRQHLPGVQIFEATMSSQLVGAVNHWCPQVQVYQKEREFFESRKRAGDKVWVYTCLVPGGPWLNRTLDQQRLRQVYLGWSLVRYELEGFLHWGLNQYHADPFEQSVVKHPHGSATNFLPAGDTHVIYPRPERPLSGQRFEAHRIGLEDADLLLQLKKRSATQVEAIIQKVFRAYDDYTADVTVYRRARRELLAALGSK